MKQVPKSKYLPLRVLIQTLTWARDSNGLFDYESKNLHRKSFVTRSTIRLVRLGNDVLMKDEDYELETEAVAGLGWVLETNGKAHSGSFVVKPDQLAEQLWQVVPPVRSPKQGEGYQLAEGDILRLGRISFTVKQVSPTGQDNPSYPTHPPKDITAQPPTPSPEKLPCRICLSDQQTPEDPLISPCKCAGTMKFIHLKCLREWLQSRLNIKQSGSIVSYYWKSLDCELCKENLPSKVLLGGVMVELVDIHKPDVPFIVLEDVTRERDRDQGLGIHVLSMPAGAVINLVTFTQGRGHESDIRIQDISVSRLHASIQLAEGAFRISDRKSKFGTLVQVRRWLSLFPNGSLSLQVGRTVVMLRVKRDVSCFRLLCGCCLKTSKVMPGVAELTGADKLYEVNERSHIDDGSFSRLMAQPQPETPNSRGQLQLEPRLIAQDFAEGEERPTTRARTVGEGSFLSRDLDAPLS